MNRGKVPEMLEFSSFRYSRVTSFEIVGIEPEILVLPRTLLHPHLRAVYLLRLHSQLFQTRKVREGSWYGPTELRTLDYYPV